MEHDKKKVAPEYTKPEVKDYGDLRELTAALARGTHTDVPQNTQGPNVFSST
jgi:hypothetical protein